MLFRLARFTDVQIHGNVDKYMFETKRNNNQLMTNIESKLNTLFHYGFFSVEKTEYCRKARTLNKH